MGNLWIFSVAPNLEDVQKYQLQGPMQTSFQGVPGCTTLTEHEIHVGNHGGN